MSISIAQLQALATQSQRIHLGAVDPQGIFFLSTPSLSCPDMTAVASSVFEMQDPNGGVAQLTATVYFQSASVLALVHPFQLADMPVAGSYRVYAIHALASGGPVRSKETKTFTALDPFQ